MHATGRQNEENDSREDDSELSSHFEGYTAMLCNRWIRNLALAIFLTATFACAHQASVKNGVSKDFEGEYKEDLLAHMAEGLTACRNGHYEDALASFKTALRMAVDRDNQLDIADALANIGIVYSDIGQHAKAWPYYQQAQNIYSGQVVNIKEFLKVYNKEICSRYHG